MRLERLVAAAALTLPPITGCLDDAGSAASSSSAGPSQPRPEKAGKLCDRLGDLSLAYLAGVADLDLDARGLEDPKQHAKVVETCRSMPVEVVKCAKKFALDDPQCNKALDAYMGMTDASPTGKSRSVAWSVRFDFETYDLAISPDGHSVAVSGEHELALIRGGEVQWTKTGLGSLGAMGWSGDCLLVGDEHRVQCYGRGGAITQTWDVGTAKDGTWISAIVETEPTTIVDSRGTIAKLKTSGCEGTACVTAVGTVKALGGMQVEALDGGVLLGSDDDAIMLVAADGTTLALKPGNVSASSPAPASQGSLIVHRNTVLRPTPSNPKCAEDSAACFELVAEKKDLELVTPVFVPGIGVALADSVGVIYLEGERPWKIDAGNDGDLRTDGASVLSVGHVLGLGAAMEAPPQLRAIEPSSGKTLWITKLGTERASLLSGYLFEVRKGTAYVGTKHEVFAVPTG